MKFTRTHEFEYDSHSLFKGELVWRDNDYEAKNFEVIVYMRDEPYYITSAFSDAELDEFKDAFLKDARKKLIEESA